MCFCLYYEEWRTFPGAGERTLQCLLEIVDIERTFLLNKLDKTISPGLSWLELAVTSRKRNISRISNFISIVEFYQTTETVSRGRESQQLQNENWRRAKYFWKVTYSLYPELFFSHYFCINTKYLLCGGVTFIRTSDYINTI